MQSPRLSDPRLESKQLERALGAFDLFVLHDQPGDLDDVCFGPSLLLDKYTSLTLPDYADA